MLQTALLAAFVLLAGCQPVVYVVEELNDKVTEQQQTQTTKTQAIIACQELCQERVSTDGQDWEKGPCLSNQIVTDWVCDIAHEPRQDVDDNPENQCAAFRTGRAHHFVELDGNCNVIQVY